MNVLSVREGMKHVRDYVSQGNGPMVVEMSTYRYHGHSMSDPGTTYRNRDEIAAMEKDVRAEVAAACDRAKAGSPPSSIDELVGNIYLDAEGKDVPQPYIRMPDYEKSIRA